MTDVSLFEDPDGPGGAPTWTVPELAAHLGRVMAGAFPDDIWVEGQIRNLSRPSSGHVYFDLTEPTEAGRPPRSQLAVTLLAPEKQHVNDQITRAGGGVRMVDGIEVRIQGRLRWYGPRGVLQLRMHGIDPAYTIGRLQADRDRVLGVLAAEGLLDANAARPFPLVPLRIGLVTSRGSAAHADVLSELAASGLSFVVREADARTQGDDCGPSVARALRRLAADDVDLVLLVRGGGARTDLAGFDSELIARAIAAMPVPVLTGIGHEVDRSIADEVAHRAHKTPTAAAADVVAAVRSFVHLLDSRAAAVHRAGSSAAAVARARLDRRTVRLDRAADVVLARRATQLDVAARRAARSGIRQLATADTTLDRHVLAVTRRAAAQVARAERDLDAIDARIHAQDPVRALARGWSITTRADGRLVRSPDDVAPGDALVTRLAGGTIASTVTTTTPDPIGTDPDPRQEAAP